MQLRPRTLPGSADFPCSPQSLPSSSTLSCFPALSWPAFTASTFACREWLQLQLARRPLQVDVVVALPSTSNSGSSAHMLTPDPSQWLLEHLRVVVSELNLLLSSLSTCCTAQSCPSMTATSDWEFLCAAHGAHPRKCSAMSYMLHALASCTQQLNEVEGWGTHKATAASSAPAAAASTLFPSLARRLYRLFAHAHFHHPAQWQEWEERRGTTQRFLQLIAAFQLLPPQHLTPSISLPARIDT